MEHLKYYEVMTALLVNSGKKSIKDVQSIYRAAYNLYSRRKADLPEITFRKRSGVLTSHDVQTAIMNLYDSSRAINNYKNGHIGLADIIFEDYKSLVPKLIERNLLEDFKEIGQLIE